MRNSNATGFTLLELILGIAIAAVLLGVGIPSFTSTINSNRVAGASNEVVTALSLARSEASKRGVAVTVCKTDVNQTACDTTAGNPWKNGWMAFEDFGGVKGEYESASDTIIQKFPALSGSLTMAGTTNYVRYKSDGMPDPSSVVKLDLSQVNGSSPRCIRVELSGRVTMSKAACL